MNFLDMSDCQFPTLHNALDNVFHEFQTEGIGAIAEIFSRDEENILCDSGVLSNPKSLLRAVFS